MVGVNHFNGIPDYQNTVSLGNMTLGERIEARLKEIGMSQSDLARAIGVGATTVNGLIRGNARSTPHLFKIARVLRISAEYLAGESDATDQTVQGEPIEARSQGVLLRVEFPTENALTAMFEAQLRVYGSLRGVELARALAKRLPKAIARLQEVPLYERPVDLFEDAANVEPHASEHSEPPRAQRR